MTPATFALGLGTGLAAGTLIGVERQWRQRMAGLRTHALVAAGAAMFVMLSGAFVDSSPSRVAAQVVSGVGFLGAGVIMRDGFTVTGINTAATLWCSAAVGSLAGARQYGYALAAGAAVVAVNVVLRAAARRIDREPGSGDEVVTSWRVETTLGPPDDGHVRALLLGALRAVDGARLQAVETVRTAGEIRIRADLTGTAEAAPALDAALAVLGGEPAVTAVSWRQLETRP
ncbi:membrane protein [Longispora fulva]|uniref:Putative Mg2+ transporter-C (MgtC) family protein n=1 Tax=Longispora fulva TaxID=619741 RepID=A0A8J7GAQ0_9ACTN|nr:MgtC/SapB family protein [Longispora fulva]MBG6134904.1 putative Mg2+ transporter-C (MgtC) family protein [Longispora fulva]GIG56864.1 membrane protein [Longispora fulva]